MTAFVIRPALQEDADTIAAIHIRARREAMPWLPVLHDDDDVRRWIAGDILPACTVRVAVMEGRVAGFAALKDGDLEQLYIRPGHQGLGIGSALLDEAKRLSPRGLALWAFQRNTPARAFYEKRGFKIAEETDGSGNEEKEPDVRYVWRP
jgi:GNAT superfamily N-acetyltransferase